MWTNYSQGGGGGKPKVCTDSPAKKKHQKRLNHCILSLGKWLFAPKVLLLLRHFGSFAGWVVVAYPLMSTLGTLTECYVEELMHILPQRAETLLSAKWQPRIASSLWGFMVVEVIFTLKGGLNNWCCDLQFDLLQLNPMYHLYVELEDRQAGK